MERTFELGQFFQIGRYSQSREPWTRARAEFGFLHPQLFPTVFAYSNPSQKYTLPQLGLLSNRALLIAIAISTCLRLAPPTCPTSGMSSAKWLHTGTSIGLSLVDER